MDMERAIPLAVILLVVVGMFSTVVAQEEFEVERETETREVEVETDAESVEIESKFENSSTGEENAFEVEFESDEQVEIKLKFKEGREINGSEQETELSYAVETEQLIEFDDQNGNGVFDSGEAISTYSLEDREFEPVSYETRETENGVTEHVVWTESSDGVFKIILHVAGSFAELESTEINPTDVKIDFYMNGYSFESENSRLALLSKLKTERETEQDGVEEEEGVTINAGDVQGFFTWKRTATVDGQTEAVSAEIRPRDEAGEQGIVLSYPQGDRIVHDPRVGFRIGGVGEADSAFLTAVIVFLVTAAAFGIWRLS